MRKVDLHLWLCQRISFPAVPFLREAIEIGVKHYGCAPEGEIKLKRKKHVISHGFDESVLENFQGPLGVQIPDTEFYFYVLPGSYEFASVGLVSDSGKWGSQMANEILRTFTLFHPMFYAAYVPGVESIGDWNPAVRFEWWNGRDSKGMYNDLDIYMLRAYSELHFDLIWQQYKNGSQRSLYRCPKFFYLHNVLSTSHFEYRRGNSPSLGEWIQCEARRGKLEQFSDTNYIWSIEPTDMEHVYREIWGSGILIAAEHFEIVGWREDLLAPKLAAKPSIFEVASPWHCHKGRFLVEDVPEVIRDARSRERLP